MTIRSPRLIRCTGASPANIPFPYVFGRFNDLDYTQAQIERHGNELAAIMVGPMMGAGGYGQETVGEDMEVVVRMRRRAREEGRPGKVVFVPDPVAWTEVPERVAVLGSGHPLADIFLRKHTPQTAELHEGVAFFGRTGQAILKSLQRLHVDPTAIYGTNCVKYDGQPDEEQRETLRRELHVVQPKLVVVMGQDALSCLNGAEFPLARQIEERTGELQRLTPTIEALVCPVVDT